MKKILALVISLILAVSCLTACESKPVFTIYNWEQYINLDVVEAFRKEHPDVEVVYETFATNEDMYTKLKNGSGEYDVIFPSEYIIEKMIKEDMLAEIDYNNIPNSKYISEQCKNLSYDPDGKYSVPYMWGTLGILYNKNVVKKDEITWADMFSGEYKVIMMKSLRDAMTVALGNLGYSINTTNPKEIEEARELLSKQLKQKNFYGYGMDDVDDKMVRGEADMGLVYSGDAITAMAENKDLGYAVPDNGNKWFDAMCIPKNSKNKALAEEFINFMCETQYAKMNADEIGYYVAQSEAQKLVEEETGVLYPEADAIKNCEVYVNFDKDVLDIYNKEWTKLFA